MVINPAKSKAVCFMRDRVIEPLNYSLRDIVIPEASSCKYLGITLRSDLSWVDQGNCEKSMEGTSFYGMVNRYFVNTASG